MKREDRAKDPAPAGDFNREDQPATSDPLVGFLTTYSRMTVTPEESDAMLERVYGKGRLPGYEGRRWDRDRKPVPTCQQCGEPLKWGIRFCSQACFGISRRKQRPDKYGPIPVELLDEMQARLDDLRAYVEGVDQ